MKGVMDFTPEETNVHVISLKSSITWYKPFMYFSSLDWVKTFLFSGLSFLLSIALLYSHLFWSTVFEISVYVMLIYFCAYFVSVTCECGEWPQAFMCRNTTWLVSFQCWFHFSFNMCCVSHYDLKCSKFDQCPIVKRFVWLNIFLILFLKWNL
jgi:hypothetical protein